jgi:hypothetical protein
MMFEGFHVLEGLHYYEGALFLGVLVPVIPQDSFFFSCFFHQCFNSRPNLFKALRLNFHNSHYVQSLRVLAVFRVAGFVAILGMGGVLAMRIFIFHEKIY